MGTLMTMKVRACQRCGAVVAVASDDGGVDNEQAHAAYHKRQDQLWQRPGAFPAACPAGHASWPDSDDTPLVQPGEPRLLRRQVRYGGNGAFEPLSVQADTSAGECPACGGDRVIKAGDYEMRANGMINRAMPTTAYC